MSAPKIKVTRGEGFLESLLAWLRCRKANRLIEPSDRQGLLLDIGCGTYPYFLVNTKFEKRCGVDRVATPEMISRSAQSGVEIIPHDISAGAPLPLPSGTVEIVTMLAVYEHLDGEHKRFILTEAFRVLRPGGRLILTTPAWWTAPILTFLALTGGVSREELEEHKTLSRPSEIVDDLRAGGFDPGRIEIGTFELGLNQWARARR